MEHRKIALHGLSKLSLSSSSIANSLSLSARGPDVSPLRVLAEISSADNRKLGETTLRSSSDLTRTASPPQLKRGGRTFLEVETINRTSQQQQSSKKLTPHPPNAKPDSGIRFERRGRKKASSQKSQTARSKSPYTGKPRRSSKSPISGTLHLAFSPRNIIAKSRPMSKTHSPLFFEEKKRSASRDYKRNDLMVIRENSTPITLDRKQVDKRVIFVAVQNLSDHSSQYKQDKKSESESSVMIDQQTFAKLPFVKHFLMIKILKHWRGNTSKSHYYKKRAELVDKLWVSRPLFTRNYTSMKEKLYNLATISAVEIKESALYGKRHTDFAMKQQNVISNACRTIEKNTARIMELVGNAHQDLKRVQALESDGQMFRKILERGSEEGSLTERGSHTERGSLTERGRRVNFREKDLREAKKMIQDRLNDAFIYYVRLSYFHALLESIFNCYTRLYTVICGQRKPRFEVKMILESQLITVPELEVQKNEILNVMSNYIKVVISSRAVHHLSTLLQNSFHLVTQQTPHTSYIEHVISTRQDLRRLLSKIDKHLSRDVESTQRFIQSFRHLETMREIGFQWVENLKKDSFDVRLFFTKNYKKVSKFTISVEEIPTFNSISGVISLETISLRTQLLEIPKAVFRALKPKLVDIISSDTNLIKQEISFTESSLHERPVSLAQFVEQANGLSILQNAKVVEWEKRIEFMNECWGVCKREGVEVPAGTISILTECKNLLRNLPAKLAKAEQSFKECKAAYEEQMNKNLSKISRKIKKFELKYTARYLQDTDKLRQPLKVLRELSKRQEALLTIEKKVESYEQFDKALKKIEGEEDLRSYQLQSRKDLSILFTLHSDTVFLWQTAELWRSKSEAWLGSPFAEIELNAVITECEELCERLRAEHYTGVMFVRTAEKGIKMLNDEICEFMSFCDTLLEIRRADLKPRHWEIVFKIIRKPQFFNQVFTLQELKETHLNRFLGKINAVIQEAYEENNHETGLLDIKQTWETLEIKTVQYRNRLDTFILSDLNELKYLLHEHTIILKQLSLRILSESLQFEIHEWSSKLKVSLENLSLWHECQKLWLFLEPLFSSSEMQDYLPKEYENFLEIQSIFRNLVWTLRSTPKASLNLSDSSKSEALTDLISKLIQLKKYLKGFLENRRTSFPRFFFLSDEQLMEYLSSINSKQIYDSHIRYIFPGAAKLYLKKIESKKTPPLNKLEIDMDVAPFNIFSPAGNELLDPFEFTAEESELESSQSPLNPENSAADRSESMYESMYEDRDDHIVAKQKRLRDKYYDAVVDITTNHPYEILGLMGYNQELLLFEKSVSLGESPEIWLSEVEKQMKETLGKMISFSVATFPKQSLDEWVLDFPQQVIYTSIMLILTHEITELMDDYTHKEDESKDSDEEYDAPIPPSYDDHFSKVFFVSTAHSHSMHSSRGQLMKFLQSKSYKGLYLRLQFWINQLIKSIQLNSGSTSRLTPSQLISLSSYINLLSYLREIVKEIMDKEIYFVTDFEWQKVMRVYWNANDAICKVECGALSMVQGNEYLGNNYRMLCTPLTTRYFIFISGTIRETSAVLFKTSLSEDFAGDVFQEFANLCGVGMKRMLITPTTPLQALMMSLNGAALANIWTMFEHIERISSPNIQVLCKEIQMMQQQFIIAELGNDSEQKSQDHDPSKPEETEPKEEFDKPLGDLLVIRTDGTILEKSGVATYSALKKSQDSKPSSMESSHRSDSKIRHNIKTPHSLFVVAASLSPIQLQPSDSIKLKALQVSMRSIEMLRPDSSMIFRSILVKERFRYAKTICSVLSDLYRMLTNKFEDKLVMRYRDIIVVVMLGRVYKNSCQEEMDEAVLEFESVARACRDIYSYKLINCYACSDLDKKEKSRVIEMLDECIELCFKIDLRDSYTPLIFRKTLEEVAQSFNLNLVPHQLKQAEDAYKMLSSHKGCMILGPKCTGKSTILTLLSEGLNKLPNVKISKYTINPSLFNNLELFGSWELDTSSSGNLFKNLINSFHRDTSDMILLVLNSTSIDSRWSDSLIYLLDYIPLLYNHTQTHATASDLTYSPMSMMNLPPGFSCAVPDSLKLVFEISDGSKICPSLYTRLPTLSVNNQDLEWESILIPMFHRISDTYLMYGLTGDDLFEEFNDKLRPFIHKLDQNFKVNKLWNVRILTCSFIRYFMSLLKNDIIPALQHLTDTELDSQDEVINEMMKKGSTHVNIVELRDRAICGMVISMIWSYGGILNDSDREVFNTLFHKENKLSQIRYAYPKQNSVFDVIFDWKALLFSQLIESEIGSMKVDIQRNEQILVNNKLLQGVFIANLLCSGFASRLNHFMILGPQSSGKSTLAKLIARNDFIHPIYTKFLYGRDISNTLKPLEESFTSRDSSTYISSFNNPVLFIIDDIHLDLHHSSSFLQLISYWQEHAGYYSYQDFTFKHMTDIHFLSCSQDLSSSYDLLSQSTNILYYDTPSSSYIYSTKTTHNINLSELQVSNDAKNRYLQAMEETRGLDILSKYIVMNEEEYWRYAYGLMHYLKEPFSSFIVVNNCSFPMKDTMNIVASLMNTRILQPDVGGWETVDTYKTCFESAVLTVSHAIQGNEECKASMFVHDASKLRNENYLMYLNSVYSSDPTDLTLFSEYFKTNLLKLDLTQRRSFPVSSVELLEQALVSAREKLHLLLLVNSSSELDTITLKYPGLLKASRVFEININPDTNSFQNAVFRFISTKEPLAGIDNNLLAGILSNLFHGLKEAFSNEKTENYSVKVDVSKYFDINRISLFLNYFYKCQDLFSQNLFIKKHALSDKLDKVEDFLKRHEVLGSDLLTQMKFLESTEKKLKLYEDKIYEYQNLIKNSEIKLDELKLQQKALEETLKNLEEDSSHCIANKNLMLNNSFSELKKYLRDYDIIDKPSDREIKLFYLIGIMSDIVGNSEEHTMIQLINHKDQAMESLQIYLDTQLSHSKYNQLNHDLSEISGNNLPPTLKPLYHFLHSLQQRNSLLIALSPQAEKIQTLRSELEQLRISIFSEEKLQLDTESLLSKEHLDYEACQQNYAQNQLLLKYSESSQLKTDTLISMIRRIAKKIREKYERVCYYESNCIGDAIMSSGMLVYLGVLDYNSGFRYREMLYDILVRNGVSVSEVWKESSENVSEFYREVCDVKIEQDTVMNALGLQTINLVNHIAPNNVIWVDYSGEIKSVLYNYYAIYSTSSRKGATKLLPTPDHPHILEDYAVNYDSQTNLGWHPGPGLSYPLPSFDLTYTQTTFPIGILSSKSTLYYHDSILQHSIILSGGLNLRSCQNEIFKFILRFIDTDEYNAIHSLEQQIKELKSQLTSLQEASEDLLSTSPSNSITKSDIFPTALRMNSDIKDVSRKLAAYENGYEDILESYSFIYYNSELIVSLYTTLIELAKMIGDCIYTWTSFKKIFSLTLAKTIRDLSASQNKSKADQEEEEELHECKDIEYNEDFFRNHLLPAVFIVISSGIQPEHLCMYNLLLSMKLAIQEEKINIKEREIFISVLMQQNGAFTWKRDFAIKSQHQGRWESEYRTLEQLILTNFPDATSCMESLKFHIEASDYDLSKVSSCFKNVLERTKHKDLPLILRMIISASFPTKLTVRLLRQFIFTTLNQYFDYHEDLIKLHTFIKTASWSIPIALFSIPGMNIVNTVCSLANFYGVGLEVIRTDPEGDEDGKGTNIETIELICKCAEDGTWVLISTSKFPSFWEDILYELDTMRSEGLICNTFRVFFELQGLRSFEIPDSFLREASVRFYMSEENMEDLEGFNDVWNNILNEDIVRVEGSRTVETTFLSKHSFSIHR